MIARDARILCAAAAFAVLLPECADAAPIRIFIYAPTLVRNVQAGSISGIYNEIEKQIRELFPCARVYTAESAGQLVQRDRDRALTTGNPGDVTERLADWYAADLVVNMEFGSTGTTNNNPGRYMSTTMMDMRQGRTVARSASTADGWQWSAKDFIEETMAPLRRIAYDICPWVGTIKYERTANESSDTEETIVDLEWGTTTVTSVHSMKTKMHQEENFTFELTRGQKSVKIATSGSATIMSSTERRAKWANKGCFPQGADGVVRDVGYVSGVSDLIIDREFSEGGAKAPLLEPKVTLTLVEETILNGVAVKTPTWTLAVEGLASGKAEGTSTSERSGGCGTWSRPEGPGSGPYGRLITFVIDNLKEVKGELAGNPVLIKTENEKANATIKLNRK